MINLIRADIRRILNKRSFQMVLALTAVVSIAFVFVERRNYWNGLVFAVNRHDMLTGSIPLVLGLLNFLGIYADEFNAKSLQMAIGRGMPRRRFVAVKILDCAILSILVVLCFFGVFCLVGLVLGAHMDATDLKIISLSAVCSAYIVLCTTPLVAVLMFATGNTAFCTFIDVMLLAVIPTILSALSNYVLFHNYRIMDWYVTGFANRFYTDSMLCGGGVPRLLLGAAIYLGLSYVLGFLVFWKKELDL